MQISLLSAILVYLCIGTAPCLGGLYSLNDNVTVINSATGFKLIKEAAKDYMLEYYHMYCGYCIKYAPHLKELGTEVRSWFPLVEVLVLDCAAAENVELCADADVETYPFIKYYPKGSKGGSQSGQTLDMSVTENQLVKLVAQYSGNDVFKPVTKRDTKNSYLLLSGLDKELAVRLILQFTSTSKVPIRWTAGSNAAGGKIEYIQAGSNSASKQQNLNGDWLGASNAVNAKLKEWKLWKDFPNKPLVQEDNDEKENKRPADPYHVHAADLYSTLTRIFFSEITLRLKSDTAQKLAAMRKFVLTLLDFFHGSIKTTQSLQLIEEGLEGRDNMTKRDWRNIVQKSGFTPVDDAWFTCHGSEAKFRRYPCGLWTLFHTLTVAEYIHSHIEGDANYKPVVPFTMRDFIINVFTCKVCVENFKLEVKDLDTEVTDARSSVLYLWRVHNHVNERLSGSETDDPKYRKVQFPPKKECNACYSKNGKWNEDEVFKYLLRHYSRPSWIIDDVVSKIVEDRRKK